MYPPISISFSILCFQIGIKHIHQIPNLHQNMELQIIYLIFWIPNKAISHEDVLNKHEVPQINCVFMEFAMMSKLRLPSDVF